MTRPLLQLAFGPLETGRVLFRFQLDPYERMVRFVCTHVLAPELSETAILEALRAGHAFVGFDHLADSTGFLWTAHGPTGQALMGDSLVFHPAIELRAASPQACRFTIVHDGQPVHTAEGRSLIWKPSRPGAYRVQADLWIRGDWVPWAYANPIALRPIAWTRLPPLPEARGLAGTFAGTSEGALLAAGGANFPDQPPWDGGVKTWYDRIYALRKPTAG